MKRTYWTGLWVGWAVYFGVVEYAAIKSGQRHATFTYHARHALGVNRRQVHNRIGQVALGAGTVWLIQHIYKGVVDSE